MNKVELVKRVNDWSRPRQIDYYTPDFQMTSAQGQPPMGRDAVLAMGELMRAAMPDVRTVIEDIHEENGDVILTSHWEGTFRNDFDLSAMGMGVIPATGKALVFPSSTIRVSFEGDQIKEIHDPATAPEHGPSGFFKTFGVEMP